MFITVSIVVLYHIVAKHQIQMMCALIDDECGQAVADVLLHAKSAPRIVVAVGEHDVAHTGESVIAVGNANPVGPWD